MASTGILFIINTIVGALTGVFPKAMDLFGKGMDYKQELKIREMEYKFREIDGRLAIERAKAEANGKVEESYYEAVAAQAAADKEAFLEAVKQSTQPTGFWLADFMNTHARPFTVWGSVILCFVTIILWMLGSTVVNEKFALAMAESFGILLESSVGYLFGNRVAAIKTPTRQ